MGPEIKKIHIKKLNESFLQINTSLKICQEISNFFSMKAENYQFHPSYKMGKWDGFIRFFNVHNSVLSIGLLSELFEFAKNRYEIQYDSEKKETVSVQEFQNFVQSIVLPDTIDLYDYQFQSAFQAINEKRLCIESVTASGKSLTIYTIIRYLTSINKRILLIVPSVQLVEQMYSDFSDYGFDDISLKCHTIYGGKIRDFKKQIIVATWQSLNSIKKTDENFLELFRGFDGIIVDEAHGAKAKELKDILELSINAEWKIGFSGTYPEKFLKGSFKNPNWFSIVGSLGPIKVFNTYSDLQKRNIISNIKIFNIFLNYKDIEKQNLVKTIAGDYQKEIDYINGDEKRNSFLMKLVQSQENNILVLFTKIKKHGKVLFEKFKELKGKTVYYIDGSVSAEDREKIRERMETETNIVLLASYGTLSQGVNIKNIHSIIFASGYKSRIKVLQSIGRGLRKHVSKDILKLFDIVDDFSCIYKGRAFKNYGLKHFLERKKMYEKENFEFKDLKYFL